jgi:prepilin peptidase CpaA
MQTKLYLDLFLLAAVMAAAVHDLAVRKIPNRLIWCGLLCASVLHLASPAPFTLVSMGLAGFAVGLLLFLPLYWVRGMAAGDVKLMAMVGAFTGPMLALEIGLATFCIGGLMALAIVIAKGRLAQTFINLRALLRPLLMRLVGMPYVKEEMPGGSVGNMPYGLAIASATYLLLWFRHT